MLLINVYHGGQILNTSIGVGYDIRAACTFSVNETINLRDLKRQYFGWQKSAGDIVHRYCTQHIAQNVYKNCHMKKNKTSFKTSCKT
jgi:hypothetical protein